MKINLYIFSTPADAAAKEKRIRTALRHFKSDQQDFTASSIELRRTEKGRPYLVRNGRTALEDLSVPDISVTDSGSYWIVAVSDRRIGIDLQENRIRKGSRPSDDAARCRRLAFRYFHESESAFILSAQTEQETVRRFFQIWTAKEAYVKYTGTGIDGTFSSFAVNGRTRRGGWVPGTAFSYRNPELGCEFIYPQTDGSRTLCVCAQQDRISAPISPDEYHLCYLERIPSI
ncbi:MAG: 4'-phosphopantetheinyl transferase family protein [Bilifractor sp.]|jgi:phosphopantetheinyl transferase